MTPAGTIRDEPIFRPDPDLEIARNVAWMLAVGLALWLATNAVKRVSSPARQPRWVLVASAGGLAAGTVVGIAAWWLERPGTLVSPGEVGLRAITSELTTILGPLGALVGPPIAYAGHSAWLLLAPPVTYALYGALFGICILMLRAVRALQPNDR